MHSQCSTLNLFLITAPDSNPEDVRSESTDPDTLVITWEVHQLPECTIHQNIYL